MEEKENERRKKKKRHRHLIECVRFGDIKY